MHVQLFASSHMNRIEFVLQCLQGVHVPKCSHRGGHQFPADVVYKLAQEVYMYDYFYMYVLIIVRYVVISYRACSPGLWELYTYK